MRNDVLTRRMSQRVILAASLCAIACGKTAVPPSPGPGPAAPGGAAEARGHAEAEAQEQSDLDRPVEELFLATCEHRTRTFECDECRYETGVVKVAAHLIEGGLVRVAQAGQRPVDAPIVLTGEVRFDDRRVTHLAPRTDGVLRTVHVQVGDRVKAGQILLEVDSIVLGDAQGEYLQTRAARELASRTLDRQKALRSEGVSSEREALEAANAFEAADIRNRAASERLLRLGLDRSDLRSLDRDGGLGAARGRLVVRSPVDGRVVDMHAVAGEAARAGESLMVVGETDPVWVNADLYEDHLGTVQARLGAGPVAAIVSVKAFPGEAFPGTLDLLGSVMDRETRTVKARVTAANPEGKLRPGMFAQVRLGLPGDEQVLAIPRSAVMEDEGRSFVFVPHHGEFWVRRPVRTGREWDGWIEVKAGIQPGQHVAADGAFLLKSDVLRSKMGAGCAD